MRWRTSLDSKTYQAGRVRQGRHAGAAGGAFPQAGGAVRPSHQFWLEEPNLSDDAAGDRGRRRSAAAGRAARGEHRGPCQRRRAAACVAAGAWLRALGALGGRGAVRGDPRRARDRSRLAGGGHAADGPGGRSAPWAGSAIRRPSRLSSRCWTTRSGPAAGRRLGRSGRSPRGAASAGRLRRGLPKRSRARIRRTCRPTTA